MIIGLKRGVKAQVTLFIILAILLFMTIILVYFLAIKPPIENSPGKNPSAYIEKCRRDAVVKSSKKILDQGGYKIATNYLVLNETKAQYHCYTANEDEICRILEPMMKAHIEEEIRKDTLSTVDDCFANLKNDLQRKYDYTELPNNYAIEIKPGKITAISNKEITLSQNGDSQRFVKFVEDIPSPAFDFVIISNAILYQETTCDCGVETCSGDVVELSRLNSDFELELFVNSINEKIYTIREINNMQEFHFSVRNCIRLP